MTRFIERRDDSRKASKPIVVFYHADCTDGFTAAWAAWKKFGSKAEYIANFHEDEPPQFKNKTIYTLDMTFPEPITGRLMRDNIGVTSIDHHISSKTVTLITHKPLYALDHSGCVLAWKYFHPLEPIPKFLLSVEDRDIWRNKIPDSKGLFLYLDLFDFNFQAWSRLIRDFESPSKRKNILNAGNLLFKHENKIIDYHINKNAKLVKFEGYKVYAINSTDDASEMGAKLARLLPPFSIIWRENKDGFVLVSLRGVGDIDCSVIAKKYGGGGHKHSAAFRVASLRDIPWSQV